MAETGRELPAGLLAELELRRHFEGRRDGPRLANQLPVELHAHNKQIDGITVDVSRSGILVAIDSAEVGEGGLAAAANTLHEQFANGLRTRFPGPGFVVPADIVRIGLDADSGSLLLACRFLCRLNRRQRKGLGVEDATESTNERRDTLS